MFNPSEESSIEHVIASGPPELVTAWQAAGRGTPRRHSTPSAAIAYTTSAHAWASSGLITEYANADNFRLDDRAIWGAPTATASEAAAAVFKRPDCRSPQ